MCKLWLASRTLFLLFFPEYLSINKGQTVKAVALDSRSDFVAWLSAIRLAKFGTDLSLAYHRNLNSRQYLQQQSTKPKSNVTKTSSSNIDFQKVKGKIKLELNILIKFKNVEKKNSKKSKTLENPKFEKKISPKKLEIQKIEKKNKKKVTIIEKS